MLCAVYVYNCMHMCMCLSALTTDLKRCHEKNFYHSLKTTWSWNIPCNKKNQFTAFDFTCTEIFRTECSKSLGQSVEWSVFAEFSLESLLLLHSMSWASTNNMSVNIEHRSSLLGSKHLIISFDKLNLSLLNSLERIICILFWHVLYLKVCVKFSYAHSTMG